MGGEGEGETNLYVDRDTFREALLHLLDSAFGGSIEQLEVADTVFLEEWACHCAVKSGRGPVQK